MLRSLTLLIAIGGLMACSDVKPGEQKATVVAYDPSYSICGGSWIIEAENKQVRVLSLPESFRKANTAVWITYEPDPARSADAFTTCNFVNLTSVRKR